MPITSPVDLISGPNNVSQPGNFSNGNTASFTETCFVIGSSINPISSRDLPAITNEAYFANGCPIALETNGTVLEALGFASIMYGVPSGMTAYCIFNNPTTPNRRASFGVHSRIVAKADSGTVWLGKEHAESPECTPACSICSMIPPITTLPKESHKASTSNSVAWSRYLSTKTGRSGSTSTAVPKYLFNCDGVETTSIARPPRT
mmetsp:Transcript_4641/g.13944  ORF Transcript_4641/g.13944 Transcript_4641/m.13944 type:complete len:205 (-) Transcript_4641:2425-3039(-)